MPDKPRGIQFLFSPAFSSAILVSPYYLKNPKTCANLKVTAEHVASTYKITQEEAIEEFRRLLAIKAFTMDENATKISPTPLSTFLEYFF